MRKYISILLSGTLLFSACGGTETAATDMVSTTTGSADIAFETDVYDFGKVKQGEEVRHVFKFKNTGDQPLVVEAQGSCGCTVPEVPKDPIAPGATAELGVKIDTSHKRGQTKLTVSVKSNAKSGRKELKIIGEVLTEE
ncbi:MAG: DUF1573 domain-containing protein [Bacteroidetes bacterium]|nr:DUF1573 domain-containing protein [Bacteroidota bacterium]